MREILAADKNILRELGKETAEIAALPVNETRRDLWRRLNRLEKVRPLICIYEIPWHEMNVSGELDLKTSDPLCQKIEWTLRENLYRWRHLQCDMVIEPVIHSPLAINDSGFGLSEDTDIVRTDERSAVVSRHFKIQIQNEDDIEKIKMPLVTHDEARSEEDFQALKDVFEGILPVRKKGVNCFSFNAWDELVRLTGVQEILLDMALRPDYVHKLIDRMTSAYLRRLDQLESLGLISSNNDNSYNSSGGHGYTDAVPDGRSAPSSGLRTSDVWGRAMSQIFSEVSPEMHDEFALQHEMRWLERFGVCYYGCCEPLHRKVGILKKVPRLRKISMSPWVKFEEAVENVGDKYVFSMKPNPAFLAEHTWSPEKVRDDLRKKLAMAKGCVVEIILKDISSAGNDPRRLWEWADTAAAAAREFEP